MENIESAVDVIFELRTLIKAQQQQISMLQKSVAVLDAKLNDSLFKSIAEQMPKAKTMVTPPTIVPPKSAVKVAPEIKKPAVPAPRPNIKVSGTLQDDAGKTLHGIDVKIMDANNRPVKQTKTNRSGQWMSFLPPGRYTAEFTAPGMQPDFRVFDLMAGQSEVDVT